MKLTIKPYQNWPLCGGTPFYFQKSGRIIWLELPFIGLEIKLKRI